MILCKIPLFNFKSTSDNVAQNIKLDLDLGLTIIGAISWVRTIKVIYDK